MDIGEFTERVRVCREEAAGKLPLVRNEAQTRNTLIEPLLKVMGYDTTHPAEVMPEYTTDVGTKKGEKVDYALLQDGKPVILIEAKRYKAALAVSQESQLLRYYNVTDAYIGILTDGAIYKFFSSNPQVQHKRMAESPFFEFNLLDFDDAQVEVLHKFTRSEFSADKVLHLAREAKKKGEVRAFLEGELNGPSAEFVQFVVKGLHGKSGSRKTREQYAPLVKEALRQYIQDRAPSSSPPGVGTAQEPQSLPQPSGGGEISLAQAIADYRSGWSPPSALILPDGSPAKVSRWIGVLTETAQWLAREGKLDKRLPIGRDGSKRYIVNSEPKHRSGALFAKSHEVAGHGIFVQTNLRGVDLLRNTAFLLRHLGEQRPLRLRWDR